VGNYIMGYSRELLDQLVSKRHSLTIQQEKITKILIDGLFNTQVKFSLAEEEYVCSILHASREEDGTRYTNVQNIAKCKNFWFKNRYLLYASDLNGNKQAVDFYGLIDIEQKRRDLEFLEKEFQEWSLLIKSDNQGDDLLNHLIKETKDQIKLLKRFCKKTSTGEFLIKYFMKALILHSKYIYLLVKEY
jgi:hypothetical protein